MFWVGLGPALYRTDGSQTTKMHRPHPCVRTGGFGLWMALQRLVVTRLNLNLNVGNYYGPFWEDQVTKGHGGI